MHPEKGWTEFYATAKIAELLINWGYEVTFACDFVRPETVMGCDTDVKCEKERALRWGAPEYILNKAGDVPGLIADFDTGCEGPLTALRFELDCVEVAESRNAGHFPNTEGFASLTEGLMHSCAHDGHMALGLGLAELIAERGRELCGKVRFIFQPAEEGVRGGYAFVSSGAVEKTDNFIALHIGLGVPAGTVCGGAHGFLATTKFDAKFTGRAAHAGSSPELGRNALLAAASAALAIHSIPPNPNGLTRTNVGVLSAGTGRNVVAPNAIMKIETRGATEELDLYAYGYAVQMLNEAAEKYGVELKTELHGRSIGAAASPDLAEKVCRAARLAGVRRVLRDRTLSVSDDAAWYMQAVMDNGGSATYIGLGSDIAGGHHSPEFDFDESVLAVGLGTLLNLIFELNG